MIRSTVGLEALLHDKPVLTLGQPFYPGYGVTVDVDSFREIPGEGARAAPVRPDRERTRVSCTPRCGAAARASPVLVDRSDENARRLAGSIERGADAVAGRPAAPALA